MIEKRERGLDGNKGEEENRKKVLKRNEVGNSRNETRIRRKEIRDFKTKTGNEQE